MRHFERALHQPSEAQHQCLRSILASANGTAWAKQFKITSRSTIEDFRQRVPIQDPAELAPWTQRILRGETNVLTNHTTHRLVPTSGTTGSHKLIPMTAASRREFSTGVNLWMGDMMHRFPEIKQGRCYIATSPVIDFQNPPAAVPVGFAEDEAYLGTIERMLLQQILAIPTEVSKLRDDAWKRATRHHLLQAKDLRFISLWHPSYLAALFNEAELAKLSQQWPALSVISTWSDGACAKPARQLMTHFPAASHARKGLWLTEGILSIPWQNTCPIALLCGFLEFESEDGTIHLAHQLDQGAHYRPILTNHAGLYRYRLGDVVKVDGSIHNTPSICWLGRADQVSDLCGEKLSDAQVSSALACIGWNDFFALLPVNTDQHYCCLVPQQTQCPFPLQAFETQLRHNPHYDWARQVGQLKALSLTSINPKQISQVAASLTRKDTQHQKATHLLSSTFILESSQ